MRPSELYIISNCFQIRGDGAQDTFQIGKSYTNGFNMRHFIPIGVV